MVPVWCATLAGTLRLCVEESEGHETELICKWYVMLTDRASGLDGSVVHVKTILARRLNVLAVKILEKVLCE